MSFQDTYSQLPPGLDPSNLARLAQLANEQGARSREAQEAELPPDQPVDTRQPPQQPQQEAKAETGDTTDDTTPTELPPDPLAPGAKPPEETAPPPEAAAQPTQTASLDPLTGRFTLPHLARRNEPYIPASSRPPRDWGRDPWTIAAFGFTPDMMYGPFMPSPLEAYRVIQGAGAQMAQWGAPSYGQHYGQASVMAQMIGPWLDAMTGGRFTKGFNAARIGTIKMQREQMALNLDIALNQHREFLNGASGILDFYTFGGEKGSPAEQLETANRKMEDYLRQTGHQNMLNMLDTQGMKGVVDYIAYEDQKYVDSLHARAALKKATGPSDAERDEQWHGGKSEGGDGRAERLKAAGAPSAPGSAETEPAPAPDTQGAVDAEISKKYGFTNPKDMDAAHQLLNGQDPFGKGGGPGDKLMTQIQAAKGELGQRINTAAAGQGSQDDKLSTIASIDATQGQKLRSLINYDADPKDPDNKKLVALAQQVSNGNYREGNYAIVQKYTDPNTDVGRSVRRVGTLAASAPRALEAINRLKENETMPERTFEKLWNGDIRGVDDRYVQVYNAVRPLVLEAVALETGSGRPAVTTQHDMMKEFFLNRSPRQMRSLIANEARNAYGTAVQLNSSYRQLVDDPTTMAPGMFRYGMQDLNAIAHMDSATGELPPGTPESIKYAGKTVKEPRLPPLKTLSREELDRYRHVYQELPRNDPDRDFVLKQLEDIF